MQTRNIKPKKVMFFWRLYAELLMIPVIMISCMTSRNTIETKKSQSADSTAVISDQTASDDTKSGQQVAFMQNTDTDESSRTVSKTIEFANGNALDVFHGETYAGSPSGQKNAVLRFAAIGDSSANLSIYDNQGNKTSELKVAPLDKLAIADDGRFAVYGFKPTCGIAYISDLVCYDKNGNKSFEKQDAFGIYHKGVYAPDSGIFVFWASSKNSSGTKEETVMIFDSGYQLLGETVLNGISKFSFLEEIEIDDINKQIILHRVNKANGMINKEQIVVNLKGEIIK